MVSLHLLYLSQNSNNKSKQGIKHKASYRKLANHESVEEPAVKKLIIECCLMLLAKELKVLWRGSAHETI